MKGYIRYDKNTIHLPRQYLPLPHGPVCPAGHGGEAQHRRSILH